MGGTPQSVRLPPPFRGLGSIMPYRSCPVGSADGTSDLPAHCRAACPICKSSAAISIPIPWCIRFCHIRKGTIVSSVNPLHARGLCGNSAHSTYRTTRYPMNAIPTSRTHPAFGLSSHSDLELLNWTAIGQSTCRSVFGASCQSMKRLSATMIPTSPIFPLLCAPNGWSFIDTRDTCAVCESHLGSNTNPKDR